MSSLLLFLFSTSLLVAAPAFQGTKTFHQNDGTYFSAQVKGDEYLHWIETDNEDILLFNKKNNQYEHAVIINNELTPSGNKYTLHSAKKSSSQKDNKLTKHQLKNLWEKKRLEAYQKRKPKQKMH